MTRHLAMQIMLSFAACLPIIGIIGGIEIYKNKNVDDESITYRWPILCIYVLGFSVSLLFVIWAD